MSVWQGQEVMSKPIKHGKKWQVRWFDENGKRRSEVYVSYRDAEFALKAHQTEVEEIRRGFKLRPSKDRSFDELCVKWMQVRAVHKRKPQDDESIIRVHLKPYFSGLCLRQITSERIAEFSADLMATKAPQTVKNVLTFLGSMLRQAEEWGWLERVPKIRKPKVSAIGKDYRWFRTTEEITRFLDASKEDSWPVMFPFYATAIYTGLRAGELAGLLWANIDFERRLITVQRSFGGPTKTGKIRHVPILDILLPVLKSWKLASGSKTFVFPNKNGQMWDNRGRIFKDFFQRTLIRAGFPPRYVHFHGLRHTFSSHWVLRGGDLFRLQKILGHADATMTQRYAHLSPAAYESDWARFGGPMEDAECEVIELAQTK